MSCTLLVLPYAFLLMVFGFVLAMSSKTQTLRNFSNKFNIIILALLLVDLPGRYILRATDLLNGDDSEEFYKEIIGLLSSTSSYLDFYAKVTPYYAILIYI
jgi:hypothetical protein